MKFLTVRDFVVNQKKTRQTISKEQAIITYNGKPIALLNPLNEDNFENVVREQSSQWAVQAMKNMQKTAMKHGITEKDVEKEIKAVRKLRAKKNVKSGT